MFRKIIDNAPTKSGNNTFTGKNTFLGSFYIKSNQIYNVIDAAIGQPPDSQKDANYGVEDKNGVWLGGWESGYRSDGVLFKNMAVRRADGSNNYSYFGVFTNSSNGWAEASQDIKESIGTWARPVSYYRNGTSWYRIWSDGWVEQGGDAYVNNANVWVNFFVQMADTNYYCGCKNITNNSYSATASMENPQTNGIYIRSVNNCNWRWMVAGQGA